MAALPPRTAPEPSVEPPPRLHNPTYTHASCEPGRSEVLPKTSNRACYHPAVRAALPAQRVTSFAAARNSIVLSGINYATPSTPNRLSLEMPIQYDILVLSRGEMQHTTGGSPRIKRKINPELTAPHHQS